MSSTIIIFDLSMFGISFWEITRGAPLFITSEIKSWPSKFSPFIAIKREEVFMALLSVEMLVMVAFVIG